jgi:cell division protein FtsL
MKYPKLLTPLVQLSPVQLGRKITLVLLVCIVLSAATVRAI